MCVPPFPAPTYIFVVCRGTVSRWNNIKNKVIPGLIKDLAIYKLSFLSKLNLPTFIEHFITKNMFFLCFADRPSQDNPSN